MISSSPQLVQALSTNASCARWLERAERLGRRVYAEAAVPRWRLDRRTLAVHEAAHAVMLEVTCRPCGGATIDNRRTSGGGAGQVWTTKEQMHAGPRPLQLPAPPLLVPRLHLPRHRAAIMILATAAYAGRQAEYLFRGIVPDGVVLESSADDAAARRLLSHAFGASRSTAPFGGCQELTRDLLRMHWREVVAVAELLLACSTVSGDAIRKVIARVHGSSRSPGAETGLHSGRAAANAQRLAYSRRRVTTAAPTRRCAVPLHFSSMYRSCG